MGDPIPQTVTDTATGSIRSDERRRIYNKTNIQIILKHTDRLDIRADSKSRCFFVCNSDSSFRELRGWFQEVVFDINPTKYGSF